MTDERTDDEYVFSYGGVLTAETLTEEDARAYLANQHDLDEDQLVLEGGPDDAA